MREMSVTEQRYKAVLAVIGDGRTEGRHLRARQAVSLTAKLSARPTTTRGHCSAQTAPSLRDGHLVRAYAAEGMAVGWAQGCDGRNHQPPTPHQRDIVGRVLSGLVAEASYAGLV